MLNHRQLFFNHLAQTTAFPLAFEIERAEGIYLYGPNGKKWIDLISGIGVSNIGHRHPNVIKAINQQTDKYLHLMVYGELIQSPQVLLAEALVKTLPKELDNVYLLNSGGEAIEMAIKLAKRFTGRPNFVSCINAYHGSTNGALSAGGAEWLKQAYRPLLPGFTHIEFGNTSEFEKIDHQTAAIIIETIQGEAGVRVADSAYFIALRRHCHETGTLLILDEIQCGMGRTGTLWAFEQKEIVPDILVSAKALGGGMPIGALITSKLIMNVITENPLLGHITTFGGHPVSSAAALACIKTITSGSLLEKVKEKAELFGKLLVHPEILEIRNAGLMMAVEFESFERLQPIILAALENGLLTDWFLFCNKAMRIAPPLTITNDEIRVACGIILEAIDATKGI